MFAFQIYIYMFNTATCMQVFRPTTSLNHHEPLPPCLPRPLGWFFITRKPMMTEKSRHNNRWQTQIVSEPARSPSLRSLGPGIQRWSLLSRGATKERRRERDHVAIQPIFINSLRRANVMIILYSSGHETVNERERESASRSSLSFPFV